MRARLLLPLAVLGVLVACADPSGRAAPDDVSDLADTSLADTSPDSASDASDADAPDGPPDVPRDAPADADAAPPDADPTDTADPDAEPADADPVDVATDVDTEADTMPSDDQLAILSLNLHCLELGGTSFTDHTARFAAIADLVATRGVVAIAVQEACDNGTLNALDALEAALESATGTPWSSTWAFAHVAWEGTAQEAREGVAILARGELVNPGSLTHRAQNGLWRVMAYATVTLDSGPLHLVSVHFDHQHADARLAQAREAAAFPLALFAPSQSVLVAGDFNASATSPAPLAMAAMGYRNLAEGAGREGTRIDHVFAHRGAPFEVVSRSLVFDGASNRVSDHPGVLVLLRPAAVTPAPMTRLVAHVDVGFGKTLSVRGELAPLTWTWGWPVLNTAADRWEAVFTELPEGEPVPFKFLVGDVTWQVGDNAQGQGGQTTELTPTFP